MVRKWRSGAGLISSLGLILAMVGGGIFLSAPTMLAVGQPQVICHGTNSDTNPYVENPPDIASIVKDEGHGSHVGPIWALGMKDAKIVWGDIIPPFDYETGIPGDKHDGHYPGMNWTTAGQAIYNNGCNIPKDGTAVSTQSSKTGTVAPGTSVTDTATVTNTTGSATPTGSVQFKVSFNGGEATSVGSPKTLSGAGTATSDAISGATDTAAGEYCWQAFFTATGNFNGSEGTAKTNECFTVAAETSKDGTAVTTQSSETGDAVAPGTSVTDTATVTNTTGSATPAGAVQFKLTFNGGAATNVGSPVTLDGIGKATSTAVNGTTTPSDTAPGTYCWQAFFTASGNFNNSEGTATTNECFTVVSGSVSNDGTAVTTLSSQTGNAVAPGTSVTDTATVTNTTGSATPTGKVQFKISFKGGAAINVGDPVTLDGSGKATSTAINGSTTPSDTATGKYCWQAFFTPTGNFETSSSTTETNECFTVATGGVEAATATPTGAVLALTGASTPDQTFGLFLIALGLITMVGGAFAWRRREA